MQCIQRFQSRLVFEYFEGVLKVEENLHHVIYRYNLGFKFILKKPFILFSMIPCLEGLTYYTSFIVRVPVPCTHAERDP